MYARKRKKSKTGSVRIRSSNNRLQLVFTYGGKRYFVSTGLSDSPFSRKQAQDKALEVERDIAYGEFDPNHLDKYKVGITVATNASTTVVGPTLSQLWQQYSEVRTAGKSPATLRMYGWVANHLSRCPHKFPDDSQAVFDWLNGNVPANSTKRVLMHLSACCKWAKKSKLLDGNPFDGAASEVKVKKTGTEEEEIYPFTREERDRILEAFKLNRYYKHYTPLVEFLFLTGCRPSEAIALQWRHVSRVVITFEQAVIYNGKGLVLKNGLKTQQSRRFPVNAQLNQLLKGIKPERCKPDTLVFPSPSDKFINWHNFTNRAWRKVLTSLPDVEYRNPYQTRHTFCSLCREADISSIQLAKWVGNSAQIIDRVYAKPLDQVTVPTL